MDFDKRYPKSNSFQTPAFLDGNPFFQLLAHLPGFQQLSQLAGHAMGSKGR